ncbi:Rv0361 family membrane protein, partial [Mycobacterium kansasii]
RKAAVERDGEAKLEEKDVKNLTVNGDSASADLTVRYEKAGERTEQAKFVREDGKWKKCS